MSKGLRFNETKTRYDLVPTYAQEQYAKVLTLGAQKYTPNNWRLGMKWTTILASLKRHIAEIEKGEDFDSETGLLHSAHVMCNAAFLTEYYKIHPQGDDRNHGYLNQFKIGLDIDEVLCSWCAEWCKRFNHPIPNHWNFSYDNKAHFEFFDKEEMDAFFLNLPTLINGNELPFEPHCYITARSVDEKVTAKWLESNGFPTSPVYNVGLNKSKVDIALSCGIDIFVDDAFHNFVELNNAGVCTYLLTTPHNLKYNVGHKRINSLHELAEKLR